MSWSHSLSAMPKHRIPDREEGETSRGHFCVGRDGTLFVPWDCETQKTASRLPLNNSWSDCAARLAAIEQSEQGGWHQRGNTRPEERPSNHMIRTAALLATSGPERMTLAWLTSMLKMTRTVHAADEEAWTVRCTNAEIALALQISRRTVMRHLRRLLEQGLIVSLKDSHAGWRIAISLLPLARQTRRILEGWAIDRKKTRLASGVLMPRATDHLSSLGHTTRHPTAIPGRQQSQTMTPQGSSKQAEHAGEGCLTMASEEEILAFLDQDAGGMTGVDEAGTAASCGGKAGTAWKEIGEGVTPMSPPSDTGVTPNVLDIHCRSSTTGEGVKGTAEIHSTYFNGNVLRAREENPHPAEAQNQRAKTQGDGTSKVSEGIYRSQKMDMVADGDGDELSTTSGIPASCHSGPDVTQDGSQNCERKSPIGDMSFNILNKVDISFASSGLQKERRHNIRHYDEQANHDEILTRAKDECRERDATGRFAVRWIDPEPNSPLNMTMGSMDGHSIMVAMEDMDIGPGERSGLLPRAWIAGARPGGMERYQGKGFSIVLIKLE